MFAGAHHARRKMQREEQSGQDARGPQSGSEKVIFEVGSMCWRTPRKHENAGPVLLGPVSHRARLRVERFAEGLGGTPAPADSGLFSK